MGLGDWMPLAGAALSGSALPSLARIVKRRLIGDPKATAEARKLNVETDGYIADRLMAEIERLDIDMNRVRAEFRQELASVKESAQDEKLALEQENKLLRTQVGRLRKRVEGLEKILKVKPITPEQQQLLDELDSIPTDGENGNASD